MFFFSKINNFIVYQISLLPQNVTLCQLESGFVEFRTTINSFRKKLYEKQTSDKKFCRIPY